MFDLGDHCSITLSGDTWHKDEFANMTKPRKERADEKFAHRLRVRKDILLLDLKL